MAFNPFAHLMGVKPRGAKAEEDEDDKAARKAKGKRADEDDEDARAGEDDEDARADDDDYDESAEEDEKDKAKGKKAKGKRAEEDDEDQADAKAQGRIMERKRCATIFGSKAAGLRPDLAASLAFYTDLPASVAVKQLNVATAGQQASTIAPRRGMSLDERMSNLPQHRIGQDAAPQGAGTPQGAVNDALALYDSFKGSK